MKKNLNTLLSVLDGYEINKEQNIEITGVTDDSRKVEKGNLFICLSGLRSSGYDYIDEVCQKGASALLVDKKIAIPNENVIVITVSDVRQALKKVVPAFFDYPALKMKMFGVTGTNGKTTVTYMLKKIAEAYGKKVGIIGTIDTVIGEKILPAGNTTPDIVQLQTILSQMQESGVQDVFMEVSSHALALDRVAGCEFDIAVLTNITQDHLDFHKTFAAYVDAKAMLFEGLSKNLTKTAKAVINMDDKNAHTIMSKTGVPVITYGMSDKYDVYPKKSDVKAKGMELLLATPKGELELSLLTTGHFNIYNVMAAVCAALCDGIPLAIIKKGLDGFTGVAGRFELVEQGQPFTVVVDYAHTPDGLENVLQSAKKITKNKLIAVFGCGGNRDKSKRPLMGGIAERVADYVYVTSDNPRNEVPEEIIKDIMTGINDKAKVKQIVDRKTAIQAALSFAKAGDVVVIAGKGHETYQILGDKTIDFDDRLVAAAFLKGREHD